MFYRWMVGKKKYRVVKYKPLKRGVFETYEPKKRIELKRENAVNLMIRAGNRFVGLGGLIGFWASGLLILIKEFFGAEGKIKKFRFNDKVRRESNKEFSMDLYPKTVR